MATIARLDVLLSASSGMFEGAMKRASKTVMGFGKLVGSYIGPLAAGAFVGWGVKLAADAEKAQTAFATMLGSADKAKVLLGEIYKFAASTPFESPELRSAAQSLLSFGVAASNIMPRLKTLGDVAAGSNSDIQYLALIYGKVLAKGKLELEQGNMVVERGIPLFSTLAKNIGVSQSKIMEMISAGQISAAQVQQAFESMAGSGGIFEDAMKKQSQTLWGLWSSLTDNIGLIATDIGQMVVEAFGFKEGLGALLTATDTIRGTIQTWKPVFMGAVAAAQAMAGYVIGAWVEIANMVAPIFQPVLDFFGSIFGNTMTAFRDNMVGVFATVEWTAKNWSRVFNLAFDQAYLAVLTFYNDVANIFTSVIPAIFNNFGHATYTFFNNLALNIENIMGEVWDFIKSGGQDAIQFNWKPLIIEEIKQAFDRELTDSEKTLLDSIKTQKDSILGDMGAFVESKIAAANEKAIELSKDILGQATKTDQQDTKKAAKGSASKTAALEKGSKAAFEAIAESKKQDNIASELAKQTKLQEKQNDKLDTIAANTSGKLLPAPI
ncbi:MAG: tape measure protein [Planctomycetaceae bacterium]